MPQTRQHIQRSYSQQRQRHSQAADAGVRLTRDGIERFMTVCQAEGRVEGRAEGAMEATFAALKNLMGTLGLPLEQAMAVLKIPESDRQRYADLLAKK